MALEKFQAPALPVPPVEYDQRYHTDLIRILRLYFNQLDSLTPNQANSYRADFFYGGEFIGDLTGDVVANTVTTDLLNSIQAYIQAATINTLSTNYARIQSLLNNRIVAKDVMADKFYGSYFYGDGQYLSTPYNQFTSDQDQTAGALGTAYAVTMNTDDFPNGVSVQSNSQITFAEPGIYLITYSIQLQNADSGVQHSDIWFRYNGSDIANSNSRFGLVQRKSAGVPSELIAVTPFMVDVLAANDYVQIMWHPSDLDVTIQAFPAVTASPGVTPAIPATPSVIVTVTHISAQHPAVKRVAPLPVYGYGQVGNVTVTIGP
jgi:hypothetical protein